MTRPKPATPAPLPPWWTLDGAIPAPPPEKPVLEPMAMPGKVGNDGGRR